MLNAEMFDEEIKAAMKAREKTRLGVLRMVKAALMNRKIEKKDALTSDEIQGILQGLVKQREDSRDQFRKGGRPELADKELAEVEILKAYLPEPLSDAELGSLIDAAIESTGAESLRDMGKVMNTIREQSQGRADMGAAGALVKARLS